MACGCEVKKGTFSANFAAGAHRKTHDGVEYLVVPVVMLRQTVVNGAYVDASELMAEAWNGVPVTLKHPMKDGLPISANSPDVMVVSHIGTIFNAKIDGDKLMAEAWIDVARAVKLNQQELLVKLEAGAPMDVSTGYFAKSEESSGVYNGKDYVVKHQDLKPDHLALLPDEEGACNWSDGCGVRANTKEKFMKPKEMFLNIAKAMGIHINEEAIIMKKEDMVDLLINKKAYAEADRPSLMAMEEKALSLMTQAFGKKPEEEDDEDAKKKKTAKVTPPAANEVDVDAIANAVLAKLNTNAPQMSAEDRAAIDGAKAIVAANRKTHVTRIIAHTSMTEESLKGMTDDQVATIANGLKAPADYSGRGVAGVTTNAGEDKVELEAMSAGANVSLFERIKAKNGGAK